MNSTQKRIVLFAVGIALLVGVGLVGAVVGGNASRERQELLETTPEGTPVESLVDCPWGEASCVLALGIERALQAKNIGAVIEFAEPRFYICPGGEARPGGPYPLCDGEPEFEGKEGYPVARRYSEGSVVDEASLRAFVEDFMRRVNPEEQDEVGSGELKLYAFGCPQRAVPFQNVSCARLAIILSAMVGEGPDARRELLIFWAVGLFRGRTLPVTEVWEGIVLESERAVLFETGGDLGDLGEVYVIDQSLR